MAIDRERISGAVTRLARVGVAVRRESGRLPGRRLRLPAGASLGLHLLVAGLAGLVIWDVAWRTPRPGPEVYITFDDPGQGTGTGGTPVPPPSSVIVPERAAAPLPPMPSEASAPVLTGLSSPASSVSALTITSEAAAPPSLLTGATPTGADVKFAGLGASSAKGVVYVIDASGPMVSSLPEVVREVARSISRLGPSQRFGVVVFRKKRTAKIEEPGLTAPAIEEIGAAPQIDEAAEDGPGYEWFTPSLVRATPEAKERVAVWLTQVRPGGRSTPLDGLRAAIGMKPDAVFLLSRSIERSGGGVWDLGLNRTMSELDRLNPKDPETGRRPIAIKTIQFLDEDPTGIMQSIGRTHGGAKTGAEASAYTVIRRGADLASK